MSSSKNAARPSGEKWHGSWNSGPSSGIVAATSISLVFAYLSARSRKIGWRWWQWVAFLEVGRVAPEWDLGDLHTDMKLSGGVSVRIMIGARVFRFTLATSEESTQFWFLIGQAF